MPLRKSLSSEGKIERGKGTEFKRKKEKIKGGEENVNERERRERRRGR